MFLYPKTKSRKGSSCGWHLECKRLEWSIAPRFIVRGEEGKIHAYEQIIVAHIEYTITAGEVGRDKEDLDLISGAIVQFKCPKTVHHHVIVIAQKM